jgi:hypothetical protein
MDPSYTGQKGSSGMGGSDQVSHADIYRALGILEGKLDAMNTALSQKHSDISDAFTRISTVENRVSVGLGIALACSVIIPILVTALAPKLHLGHQAPPAITYPQR